MSARSITQHVLAAGSLSALLGVLGCNVLLGIDGDEYRDVAVELCGCGLVSESFSDCEQRIRTALDTATPEQRRAWLSEYDSRGCGRCDDEYRFASCLQSELVCRREGEPCNGLLDCCGVVGTQSWCIQGECAPCRKVGESCTESNECCGAAFSPGEVYCHQGQCVAESKECKRFIESCSDDADCCGSEADTTTCMPLLGCFETCLPGSQNCPGCCAKLSGTALPVFPADRTCFDGPETAAAFQSLVPSGVSFCDMVCELGTDEACPTGYTCKSYPINTALEVQLCLGPYCFDSECPSEFFCATIPVDPPAGAPPGSPSDELKLCVPRK